MPRGDPHGRRHPCRLSFPISQGFNRLFLPCLLQATAEPARLAHPGKSAPHKRQPLNLAVSGSLRSFQPASSSLLGRFRPLATAPQQPGTNRPPKIRIQNPLGHANQKTRTNAAQRLSQKVHQVHGHRSKHGHLPPILQTAPHH